MKTCVVKILKKVGEKKSRGVFPEFLKKIKKEGREG